jgi:hypothetical protein
VRARTAGGLQDVLGRVGEAIDHRPAALRGLAQGAAPQPGQGAALGDPQVAGHLEQLGHLLRLVAGQAVEGPGRDGGPAQGPDFGGVVGLAGVAEPLGQRVAGGHEALGLQVVELVDLAPNVHPGILPRTGDPQIH